MDRNQYLLEKVSRFLQRQPDFITEEMLRDYCRETGFDEETGFRFLFCAALDIDPYASSTERIFAQRDIPEMLHSLEVSDFARDAYFSLSFPEAERGRWTFRWQAYKPYEVFVCDDFRYAPDRVIPQLGYFSRSFPYPAVLQDGREWMTVTPNEIATMRDPIARARGQALTFGLGMGYFAFHALQKEEVESLTVVERDADGIELFTRHLLPQFPGKEKLTLVQDDAFAFAQREFPHRHFDTVFTDLWHDPSDGVPLYQRMKALESLSPGTDFSYWIERTMRYYL